MPPLCVFDRLQPRLPSSSSYLSITSVCLPQVRDAAALGNNHPKSLLLAAMASPPSDGSSNVRNVGKREFACVLAAHSYLPATVRAVSMVWRQKKWFG